MLFYRPSCAKIVKVYSTKKNQIKKYHISQFIQRMWKTSVFFSNNKIIAQNLLNFLLTYLQYREFYFNPD